MSTVTNTPNQRLDQPFLTVADVCAVLGISRGTFYAVYRRRDDLNPPRGYLTPIRRGRRDVYDADQVRDLIKQIKSGEIRIPTRTSL